MLTDVLLFFSNTELRYILLLFLPYFGLHMHIALNNRVKVD